MNAWKDELTLDMIPEGLYHKIAEAIGVQNFVTLTEITGGTTFYLPKTESLFRPIRDAKIKEDFDGCNHHELAIKYNVTDSWVRQLCGKGHLEGQIELESMMDVS